MSPSCGPPLPTQADRLSFGALLARCDAHSSPLPPPVPSLHDAQCHVLPHPDCTHCCSHPAALTRLRDMMTRMRPRRAPHARALYSRSSLASLATGLRGVMPTTPPHAACILWCTLLMFLAHVRAAVACVRPRRPPRASLRFSRSSVTFLGVYSQRRRDHGFSAWRLQPMLGSARRLGSPARRHVWLSSSVRTTCSWWLLTIHYSIYTVQCGPTPKLLNPITALDPALR